MVRPHSSFRSLVVYKASKLLEILKGSRCPISLPFMPVDVRKEARTRRLVERGAEDGAKNLPMPASGDLRLAEPEIVTDISAERERCARDLASHLRAYRDGLSGLQTGMDVAGLRQEADEAIRRVHEIRSRWSGSGTAIWKGYAFDDPYPGYGPAARRRNDAADAYNGEHQALINEAADIADEYSDKAERAIEKTGSRPRCRPEGPRPTPATGGIREPTCSRPFPPFCSSCPATPLIQRPPSCGR
jgi:hypothetical protein